MSDSGGRRFRFRSTVGAPPEDVFAWHERDGAFERLTPPWERIELLERTGGIRVGARTKLRLWMGPVPQTWTAEHDRYEPGRLFRDVQVSGPFARWIHEHRMEPSGADATLMDDDITYAFPLDPIAGAVADRWIRGKLERQFAYRHRILAGDLALHNRYPRRGVHRVLVTGASGLIGSALRPFLTTGGYDVLRLVRHGNPGPDGVAWPDGLLRGGPAEGVDAVVHLGGENIASGRWTEDRKRRIRDSRVEITRGLAERMAKLERKPRVLVCASGLGVYGVDRREAVDESAPFGEGFLAEVGRDWEEATRPAEEAGIRVVHLRFGVVLSPAGGALARMLPAWRVGLGGALGSGDQPMPWIGIDDVLGVILASIHDPALQGAVNAVAPHVPTNRDFAAALGRAVNRPAPWRIPGFLLRAGLGEMAGVVLGGINARPARLERAGYPYLYPDIDACLGHLLGRDKRPAPAGAGDAHRRAS